MTKNWLEYDQKISQRRTLLIEYDQKMFTVTNQIFWIWPKFMTPTHINFTPQKYAGAIGLDRSPSPGSQAHTGFAPLQEKNIRHGGSEDPGSKVKVCRFHKVCWFQFWSYSINNVCRCHVFGHIHSVKWLFLFFLKSKVFINWFDLQIM